MVHEDHRRVLTTNLRFDDLTRRLKQTKPTPVNDARVDQEGEMVDSMENNEKKQVVNREENQRKTARKEILFNIEKFKEPRSTTHGIPLFSVSPIHEFPMKYLTRADQYVMAVDKIGRMEIRKSLVPRPKRVPSYTKLPKAQLDDVAYSTRFELDEDAASFSLLLAGFAKYGKTLAFRFVGETIIATLSQSEDRKEIEVKFDFYETSSDDLETILNGEEPLLCSCAFTLKPEEGTNYSSLLGGGEPAWNARWGYEIVLNCEVGIGYKALDGYIKDHYEPFAMMMRGVLSAFGVYPSHIF